ncbi:hypothetical protein GIS00_05470 [Nakamurella sp. YIM 132087]|uniref:Uncharacterized protein n=1 Tax=Nakamurella alba TaxID=2665158 RepID=A0A7K1FGZ5_9ACTN|nr:hypothetical protein [Nakamurella alba]MTD13395.1 hypothetical protein [Nakamurella alba]
MGEKRITWDRGGRVGWQVFCNGVAAAVNSLPHGPRVDATSTGGRRPVGSIRAGEVTLRIRPGQSLLITDRLDPGTWEVVGAAW